MQNKKGFTIIEMVVTTGIIAILAALTSSLVVSSLKNYRTKNQSVQAEEKVAAVMREFEQNIRAASSIESISDTQITYYRFFDGTSVFPKRVRYFMDGSQFKVGITDYSGTAPNITYSSENEKIELVIPDVVNGDTILKYYNGNNAEVMDYNNVPAVTMVGITIELDRDSNSPPAKVTATTKVNLRNMKKNL